MRQTMIGVGVFFCLLVVGCAGASQIRHARAVLNETPLTHLLRSVPPPARKIAVVVYRFRDMTGQYATKTNFSTGSTAVTQGATSMLITALLETGWFLPVERENLADLLTEQRIITQKVQSLNKEVDLVRNATVGEYLIAGGVTEFNDDIVTGGLGARWLGIGPTTQFRIASVGLDLRLVNLSTGVILESVSASKRIVSHVDSFSAFRFLRPEQLLEFEVGIGNNEPPQMAAREAIEQTVRLLIARAVMDGYWLPQAEADRVYFQQLLGV
ncbi:MAG: CsgG/HfaB family protein [Nitrospirae bacterium]|nr:CsgG/HfaB family protein [Candidatus Troglogloeales bacterium]